MNTNYLLHTITIEENDQYEFHQTEWIEHNLQITTSKYKIANLFAF